MRSRAWLTTISWLRLDMYIFIPLVNFHAMIHDKCLFWAYAPSGFNWLQLFKLQAWTAMNRL